MKVMIDLNVVLDVLQKREPHFAASAEVLGMAASGKLEALLPAHCLTTLHYIISKHADKDAANTAIDWILTNLHVCPEDEKAFLRARALPLDDFEDAVVATIAEATRCAHIITRNVTDFKASPISAMAPEEFLALLHSARDRVKS